MSTCSVCIHFREGEAPDRGFGQCAFLLPPWMMREPQVLPRRRNVWHDETCSFGEWDAVDDWEDYVGALVAEELHGQS